MYNLEESEAELAAYLQIELDKKLYGVENEDKYVDQSKEELEQRVCF